MHVIVSGEGSPDSVLMSFYHNLGVPKHAFSPARLCLSSSRVAAVHHGLVRHARCPLRRHCVPFPGAGRPAACSSASIMILTMSRKVTIGSHPRRRLAFEGSAWSSETPVGRRWRGSPVKRHPAPSTLQTRLRTQGRCQPRFLGCTVDFPAPSTYYKK